VPAAKTASTPFDAWFKGSVVVNEDGTPKRVYHGSGADIEAFSHEFGQYQGFYFADSPEYASSYANGKQPNVMPVYLNIKNPIHIDGTKPTGQNQGIKLTDQQVRAIILASPVLDEALSNFVDVEREGRDKAIAEAMKLFKGTRVSPVSCPLANDIYPDHMEDFNKQVRKLTGYDGYVISYGEGNHTVYIAWFPNQIKSAIGNAGTFDPKDNRVTASIKKKPSIVANVHTQEDADALVQELKSKGVETKLIGGIARRGLSTHDIDLLLTSPHTKQQVTAIFTELGWQSFGNSFVSPSEAAREKEREFHQGWSEILFFRKGEGHQELHVDLWMTDPTPQKWMEFEEEEGRKTASFDLKKLVQDVRQYIQFGNRLTGVTPADATPERVTEVMEELKSRAEGGTVTIYRSMDVPDTWTMEDLRRHVGLYWTLDESFTMGVTQDEGYKHITMYAEAPIEAIDWVASIAVRLNNIEDEVRLHPGAPVTVEYVEGAEENLSMPLHVYAAAKYTGPYAFYIEIPESARDHFWDEPPAHNYEFWAFRSRPQCLKGERIIFTMDKKPVAETICHHVEKPGTSKCELTGKFEKHWKVYWNPSDFKKYKTAAAISNMYHGTGYVFNDFKPNADGLIFFTPKKSLAESFALDNPAPRVLECTVDCDNVFNPRDPKHQQVLLNALKGRDADQLTRDLQDAGYDHLERFANDIQALGFDGIWMVENSGDFDTLAVFSPDKITVDNVEHPEPILTQEFINFFNDRGYTRTDVTNDPELMAKLHVEFDKTGSKTAGATIGGDKILEYLMKLNNWSKDIALQVLGLDGYGGEFELKDYPLSRLKAGDDYMPSKAKSYSELKTEVPPIILGYEFNWATRKKRLVIKDGNHRVAAAKLRGDKTIKAYVQVNDDKELTPSRKSPGVPEGGWNNPNLA
jgi:hypothetical protein